MVPSFAMNNFEETTKKFIQSMQLRDVDQFVSFYYDSVLYRDPVWGSVNNFSLQELRNMFGGFFDSENGFSFEVKTTCINVESETLMTLMSISDPQGNQGEYAGCFIFRDGKIVEQIDFGFYTPKDLLGSPRFLEYFKKENLAVMPLSDDN